MVEQKQATPPGKSHPPELKIGAGENRNYVNSSQAEERIRFVREENIPEFSRLSVPERILLVEDLWDSIASEESAVPVPRSHIRELNKRFTRYQSAPGKLLSLAELQGAIEKRK